jgi:hypothetical protein
MCVATTTVHTLQNTCEWKGRKTKPLTTPFLPKKAVPKKKMRQYHVTIFESKPLQEYKDMIFSGFVYSEGTAMATKREILRFHEKRGHHVKVIVSEAKVKA